MRTSRAADFCIGQVNFISTTDGKTAANLMDIQYKERLIVQKVKAQRIGRAIFRIDECTSEDYHPG